MNPIESSSKTQLFSHFARVAKPLASPVRLELLEALSQGEHSLSELARAAGVRRLRIKDESQNPTGSFKARGMSAAITRAKASSAWAASPEARVSAAPVMAAMIVLRIGRLPVLPLGALLRLGGVFGTLGALGFLCTLIPRRVKSRWPVFFSPVACARNSGRPWGLRPILWRSVGRVCEGAFPARPRKAIRKALWWCLAD
jgi:DNA-binding transcriptional ArsR family regulator